MLEIQDESDRKAGEKSFNYKSVCYFSTTDSAMDLSIHSKVRLLTFQSCGQGHRFLPGQTSVR